MPLQSIARRAKRIAEALATTPRVATATITTRRRRRAWRVPPCPSSR